MKNKPLNSNRIKIEVCNFSDTVMQELLTQLHIELLHIYPDMPKPGELQPLLALMVRVDEQPMGCVALVAYAPGVAEIKRLFISPSARGVGLAKQLITTLEQRALKMGIKWIRVETGNLQPAAISLYQCLAYQPIAPYEPYIGNPVSCCFEKQLATA